MNPAVVLAMRNIALASGLAGAIFVSSANTFAQGVERATSYDPSRIAGLPVSGVNYTVVSPVTSDGFMRIYKLKTNYGEFIVHGDALMRVRLHELAALDQLEKVSASETFNKALAEAGLRPFQYVGELVTNPVQTFNNTMSGAGTLFAQIGAGIANAGKTQDDLVGGMLGVDKARRELAAHLGVDPYTDFVPLAEKMNQLAGAAATGGLVVSGALMAIPGGAGIVVSNVATSGNLANMVRDNTAAQLMDMNRRKLFAMGVGNGIAETFLINKSYTPLDATALVAALESMRNVEGRQIFIERAAAVTNHDAAYFMRRQAELMASYNARSGTLTSVIVLGSFPFGEIRGGGVLGIMPFDILSWTERTSRSIADINDGLRRSGRAGRAELRITGQATNMAKKQLKDLGWTLVENTRP